MALGRTRGAALAALAVGLGTLGTGCADADRRAQQRRVGPEAAVSAEASTVEGAAAAPRTAARARHTEERPRTRVRADEPMGDANPLRDPALER